MAIKVGVLGSKGRMGQAVCGAVLGADGLELHGGVDKDDAIDGLAGSDVIVVFTAAGQAMDGLRWAAERGTHAVIGTTGFSDAEQDELRERFTSSNALLVPNFAIGAVLLMRLAELCAPHFDTAEVIELHHDGKVDAPSGTAMATAERMAAAVTAAGHAYAADPTTSHVVEGARGGEGPAGIRLHSVRMRGMVASQEVVFGTQGQSLTLRHDTYSRDSFMPGVLVAIRKVGSMTGFNVGLDAALGI